MTFWHSFRLEWVHHPVYEKLAKTTGFQEQKLSKKAWRGTVLTDLSLSLKLPQEHIPQQRGSHFVKLQSKWPRKKNTNIFSIFIY